jgi:hypothetical protein
VPYLYAFSLREKLGKMPFGELYHGFRGICQDYADMYKVNSDAAAIQMVRLTALKKRVANKQPCPCGSNRRLGRCYNATVNQLRRQLGRSWFAKEYRWLMANAR